MTTTGHAHTPTRPLLLAVPELVAGTAPTRPGWRDRDQPSHPMPRTEGSGGPVKPTCQVRSWGPHRGRARGRSGAWWFQTTRAARERLWRAHQDGAVSGLSFAVGLVGSVTSRGASGRP